VAEKRKKVWIDRLQTLLSIRLALYFVLYQVTVWLLFAIERNMSEALGRVFGQEWALSSYLLTGVPAALLGALFVWDAVRMLHRVVGPLVRIRRAIKAVTDGEALTPIALREGDHLQELKDELNAMLDALERRGAVALTPPPTNRSEKPTVTA
jgi:hypothetical protein